jgi:hypothetical protein
VNILGGVKRRRVVCETTFVHLFFIIVKRNGLLEPVQLDLKGNKVQIYHCQNVHFGSLPDLPTPRFADLGVGLAWNPTLDEGRKAVACSRPLDPKSTQSPRV